MRRPWPTGGCRAKNRQTNKQICSYIRHRPQSYMQRTPKAGNLHLTRTLSAVKFPLRGRWQHKSHTACPVLHKRSAHFLWLRHYCMRRSKQHSIHSSFGPFETHIYPLLYLFLQSCIASPAFFKLTFRFSDYPFTYSSTIIPSIHSYIKP